MSFLQIQSLKKSFGGNFGVKEFDFAAEKGEFVTLLGPSGCGKTTVLRMVAGFETPTSGRILLDGKDITALAPNRRNVGMVFQAYALFPNMTISQNIGFGLKLAKRPVPEIQQRVDEMLATIKLPQHAAKYPYQLSGGQQQRVAVARALAVRPSMLLLDEPLSALDAKIRVSLRDEIRALQRSLGITTLFVTHDQEEALVMSDRIVVMSEGRIEQVGTPHEIYNRPRTRFVAAFVGTLNFLEGDIVDLNGTATVEGRPVHVESGFSGRQKGERVTLALRPESVRVLSPAAAQAADGRQNILPAVIEDVAFQGAIVRIKARVGSTVLMLDNLNNPDLPPPERGAEVMLTFPRSLQVLDREPEDQRAAA